MDNHKPPSTRTENEEPDLPATPRRLPTFVYRGEEWTIDPHLREIRHLIYGETPEFVPFESRRGRELLRAYKTGKQNAKEVVT